MLWPEIICHLGSQLIAQNKPHPSTYLWRNQEVQSYHMIKRQRKKKYLANNINVRSALLFNQRFELLSLPQNIFFFSLVNPALKSQHQDGTLGSGETHNSLHWFGCVSSWSGDLWMKTLSVSPPATLLLLLYYTHTPYTQNNRALITAINISIWIMEGWGKHSTLSLIHNNSEILPGWL